jgi:hypothetical protein
MAAETGGGFNCGYIWDRIKIPTAAIPGFHGLRTQQNRIQQEISQPCAQKSNMAGNISNRYKIHFVAKNYNICVMTSRN